MLTRTRSSSGGQELSVPSASHQQQQQQQQEPQPPQPQQPQPQPQEQQQQQQQRQHRDRHSTGSLTSRPNYRRSDSAPLSVLQRSCPAVPVENLVVNLDSRESSESRLLSRPPIETAARPMQHPALPPPPAPKSVSEKMY